jgi:hypothetical protein
VVEPLGKSSPAAPSRQRKTLERQKNAVSHQSKALQSSNTLNSGLKPSIPPPLAISLEDQALSYYFGRHVIIPDGMVDIVQGYDQYMPLMFMQARTDSAFRLATLAISYGAFGNSRRDQKALTASVSYYFKAVSTTKDALQDNRNSCSDQALLATLVLSLYETVSWQQEL